MPAGRVKPPRVSSTPAVDPRLRPLGLDSSPLHGELLGVERLEERARALAAGFTLSRHTRRRPHRVLRRLADDARVLRHAYRTIAGDVRRGEAITRNRERHIGSGQAVLPEPVVVQHRRSGMHDGPAHDAGEQEAIEVYHFLIGYYQSS